MMHASGMKLLNPDFEQNSINIKLRSYDNLDARLFFLLAVIMISVITLLMMKITIYGETRELGIYKAIGFSSFRLRLQLAQRFTMITAFGGSIGIIHY